MQPKKKMNENAGKSPKFRSQNVSENNKNAEQLNMTIRRDPSDIYREG